MFFAEKLSMEDLFIGSMRITDAQIAKIETKMIPAAIMFLKDMNVIQTLLILKMTMM